MTDRIKYVLLTDGSSDKSLEYILNWLLRENFPQTAIDSNWADLRRLANPPRSLPDRIKESLKLYSDANLLFVHRDAEAQLPHHRREEIATAIAKIAGDDDFLPYICVIPVRMQEAWLLFDEVAIRQAAGNPNGRISINLPALNRAESIPDPKQVLHDALKKATELRGRRLNRFNTSRAALRVAELIDDFSPLRQLSAFQTLESDIQKL